MKSIYITSLLVLIFGVGIVIFLRIGQPNSGTFDGSNNLNTQSGNTVDSEALKRQEQNSIDIQRMNAAIISSDPRVCADIVNIEIKQVCTEQSTLSLAVSENDLTKCELLSVTGAIECKDQIYIHLAQLSGKTADCSKIYNSGILEKCQQGLELALLKEKLKSANENISEKIDCNSFTNDLAIGQCKADMQVANDKTQLSRAIESQSTENCDNIAALDLKQECKDSVYFGRAKSDRNVEICDNIINNDMKDGCKSSIKDFSDSDLFTEAIVMQSVQICKNIIAVDMKQSCIDRIRISEIIKSGKKEDCLTLNDVSLRKSCENSFQN